MPIEDKSFLSKKSSDMPPSQKEQEDEKKFVAGGKSMGLLDHLNELRQRLIVSLLVITITCLISFFFSSSLILFLKNPLINALPTELEVLHFTGPMEVFLASLRVSFFSGLILSSPVWFYQFWKFLEPALYESERKYILPFVIASVLLFFLGILFSFYVIIPMTLKFLIELGSEIGKPIITVSDYLSLLTVMILGFGFVFEAPLLLVMLSSLGLMSAKDLAQSRRYVVIIILIISAILTPPDPLSQIGMSVPLYIMYEISIVVIRFLESRKQKTS
ncbi:MAG: twin-arginine translocase subunit TatC [Oligoflexales bacterium]|nr:twin-arginine translocase subunit TatC [Oligoflexales bacterium]